MTGRGSAGWPAPMGTGMLTSTFHIASFIGATHGRRARIPSRISMTRRCRLKVTFRRARIPSQVQELCLDILAKGPDTEPAFE
jgi:hypothetical protein